MFTFLTMDSSSPDVVDTSSKRGNLSGLGFINSSTPGHIRCPRCTPYAKNAAAEIVTTEVLKATPDGSDVFWIEKHGNSYVDVPKAGEPSINIKGKIVHEPLLDDDRTVMKIPPTPCYFCLGTGEVKKEYGRNHIMNVYKTSLDRQRLGMKGGINRFFIENIRALSGISSIPVSGLRGLSGSDATEEQKAERHITCGVCFGAGFRRMFQGEESGKAVSGLTNPRAMLAGLLGLSGLLAGGKALGLHGMDELNASLGSMDLAELMKTLPDVASMGALGMAFNVGFGNKGQLGGLGASSSEAKSPLDVPHDYKPCELCNENGNGESPGGGRAGGKASDGRIIEGIVIEF